MALTQKEKHDRFYAKPENREKRRVANRARYAAADGKTKSREKARRKLPAPTRPCPDACECCGKTELNRALSSDHCHETNQFRGWICAQCNHALGLLGDNSFMVARGVRYLQRAEAVTHPDVPPLTIP